MRPPSELTPLEVEPEGRLGLAFAGLFPGDWVRVPLPDESFDPIDPTALLPLLVGMAPFDTVIITVAARPAFDNGSVENWVEKCRSMALRLRIVRHAWRRRNRAFTRAGSAHRRDSRSSGRRELKLRMIGVIALCFVAAGLNVAFAKQGEADSALARAIKAPAGEPPGLRPWKPGAGDGDYVIGPPYAPAPELTVRPDVPKGTVYRFVMDSKDSRIYPGIAKNAPGQIVPYQRRVTVYVPSQYIPGEEAPFFVSQDSMGAGQIPTILDNMIADRRLPAMIAVMIDSGGGDAQGSERGLEYDTVSGRYAEFVETEVLPRIERGYGVKFTRDPEGRMTMGGSSGGACALSMAWFRPDLYRRVLSYSGTFVNQQSPLNPASPHGAWEYHEHLIPQSRRKPLRIWMHVGDRDLRFNDAESTLHNWVMANNRTAAVLKVKGYHYQYVFARQSGHVDGRVVAQTLPGALEYVWRGYHPRRAESAIDPIRD